MVYNPIGQKNQPIQEQNEKKYIGNAPKNNNDRNNYGYGLAEDQEVKYLYFRDRKTYTPAQPFTNEPPEHVFQAEEKTLSASADDEDFIPDFDVPPLDSYIDETSGLDSLPPDAFWDDDKDPLTQENQTNLSNVDINSNNAPVDTIKSYKSDKSNNSVDVNSNNSKTKSKYDYAKLESVPLDFLLLHIGADKSNTNPNIFMFQKQIIKINGGRWYNETFNRGYEGAISLCKEIFSIKEKLDPFKNSKLLGGKACAYLEKAFADYIKEYQKEPIPFEKTTNYKKTPNVEVSLDNPYSYISANYKNLSQEEVSIHFKVLDSLNFYKVAELLDVDISKSGFSVKTEKGLLSIQVLPEERTWKTIGKQERFGVGSLSFVALILAFKNGDNFFTAENSKKYRSQARKFLLPLLKEEHIDKEAFDLEILEVDKNDPQYVLKLPYHRLDATEKEKYFELVESFPIDVLATMLGATDFEDGEVNKWKFRETFLTENIHIDTAQNMWHSWNSDLGGRGAISLLAYYRMCEAGDDYSNLAARKNYRFDSAKFLAKRILDGDVTLSARGQALKSEVFIMPHILEPKIPFIQEYLCEKRHLPKWVVQKQINSGFLFAGYPAHWKEIPKLKTPEFMPNDLVFAVFLTVSGQAAEMRAIARSDHNAKILAKGSEKDLGGFLTKAEPKYNEYTICSFEAAIDSLSYHAIYPGRITQSCMGTEYKLAAKAASEILRVDTSKVVTHHRCCFDNDFAGIKATIRYFHYLKDLMKDEELYEDMIEKQKANPDFIIHDEVLYKDFINVYSQGRIHMFDLTVKDLEESLRQNQTFYLDVLEDKIGLEAAKMFYSIASKTLGADVVKKAYASGQFKYLNILPSPSALEKNMNELVSQTLDKLLSNHNYYLKLPDINSFISEDDDLSLSDEEKAEALSRDKKVLTEFYNKFELAAGDKLKTLVDNGSLIYSRKTFFKDWNEHLIYMKNTYPDFAAKLEEKEIEFSHYFSDNAVKMLPGGKKPK